MSSWFSRHFGISPHFFWYLEPIFWDNHPHACFIFPGPKEPLTQAVFTPLMVTMPRSTLTPAWCAKRKRLKLRPILRKGGEGSETSRLIVWSREGAWVLGGCVFFRISLSFRKELNLERVLDVLVEVNVNS